jgi:mannitol operon transcriptional antiterminator
MRTSMPLDGRQTRIAWQLLHETNPATVASIAAALQLTARMVNYDLRAVDTYLRAFDLRVIRRRGVGVWVEGPLAQREATLAGLGQVIGPRVLDPRDRRVRVLVALLDHAPAAVHLQDLETETDASRATVRRDVHAAEGWLEEHHLHLQRAPGVGLAVRGTEIDIRKALLALMLEAAPVDRLLGGGMAEEVPEDDPRDLIVQFARSLDVPTYRAILAQQLPELDSNAPMTAAASFYLAIVARRVRADRRPRLQSGQLRSLIDHPVSDAATAIARAFEERLGLALDETDVAAITEFLLGFAELAGTAPASDTEADRIERVVLAAARRIHPALAEDDQLRRSLADHIRRLRVRLRYGLPVRNPLDDEVRQRYPDVYEVATQIVAELGGVGDLAIPSEEIGFLTMYLAGSLERNRLRPKVRVTVVCPAGMATAWILVSRLLAVFPQIEVTRVVSKAAFERGKDDQGTDLVISTVPVGDDGESGRSVVVSPLLRERDVRRLSHLLGEPTH